MSAQSAPWEPLPSQLLQPSAQVVPLVMSCRHLAREVATHVPQDQSPNSQVAWNVSSALQERIKMHLVNPLVSTVRLEVTVLPARLHIRPVLQER